MLRHFVNNNECKRMEVNDDINTIASQRNQRGCQVTRALLPPYQ